MGFAILIIFLILVIVGIINFDFEVETPKKKIYIKNDGITVENKEDKNEKWNDSNLDKFIHYIFFGS